MVYNLQEIYFTMSDKSKSEILVLSAENEYQLKLLNKNLEDLNTTLRNIDKNFYELVKYFLNFHH